MGRKELKRWHLMELVRVGKITLKEAGEKIGVAYRQAKRIGRAIREERPTSHPGSVPFLQKGSAETPGFSSTWP